MGEGGGGPPPHQSPVSPLPPPTRQSTMSLNREGGAAMVTAERKPAPPEFANEPFVDFAKPENRKAMEDALRKVGAELGREYPLYIAGQKVTTVEMGIQAIEAAHKAFESWRHVPAGERAECLFLAAAILRRRKFEIEALISYEVGKTWPEADADLAETIDFAEFYGREMLRLAAPQPVTPMKGEKNRLVYIPLGVGVVIPPWNFPAAIMAGMTMAALVAGNTVLVMGGKDSIIVDEEADVDAAVEGVAVSAFGYQGQKCSACSRAIVSQKIYDTFLAKLTERVRKIHVGPAEDPANYMGPVINKSSMKSILDYIEVGKKEGRLVAGGGPAGGDGYFIQPTVIADVSPKARISQEEIFGPVLAVIPAKDFDDALEIANNTEFGLTGAVYSRNPKKLEKAADSFHVGNLYFNRKCTGAMVGAHPFGGFNMSGTDSKAGGRDYLLLFLQAKSIAERVTN